MATFSFKNNYIRTDHFMIMHSISRDSLEIYKFNIWPNGGIIEYFTFGKDGIQIGTKIKDGDPWKPWLVVPGTSVDMLSDLMDALLEFGIEPRKHSLTGEEKTALEKHLADMRKIVAKKVGVEL